jgi:hypothetical protein
VHEYFAGCELLTTGAILQVPAFGHQHTDIMKSQAFAAVALLLLAGSAAGESQWQLAFFRSTAAAPCICCCMLLQRSHISIGLAEGSYYNQDAVAFGCIQPGRLVTRNFVTHHHNCARLPSTLILYIILIPFILCCCNVRLCVSSVVANGGASISVEAGHKAVEAQPMTASVSASADKNGGMFSAALGHLKKSLSVTHTAAPVSTCTCSSPGWIRTTSTHAPSH